MGDDPYFPGGNEELMAAVEDVFFEGVSKRDIEEWIEKNDDHHLEVVRML